MSAPPSVWKQTHNDTRLKLEYLVTWKKGKGKGKKERRRRTKRGGGEKMNRNKRKRIDK